MSHFTHYWTNETVDAQGVGNLGGRPLVHTAGNLFQQAGVTSGDTVYVVTVRTGILHLLGRMKVAAVCNAREAAAFLSRNGVREDAGGEDLWEADTHLVTTANQATELVLDRPVPADQEAERLMFIGQGERTVSPKFVRPGALDRQTLRGVRRLHPDGVALFEEMLR